MTESTTVLFGLPGVRVISVSREPGGTRLVELMTDEDTAAACPSCGVFSTSVKERVSTRPKDIPYGVDRILVRWNKIRWRRREDYCTRGSFTEAIEQIPARARTTGRLRTQIGTAVGDAARSVAEVAAAHGVSWPTAHRAFVEHAEALLTEPARCGSSVSTRPDAESPGGSGARTPAGGYGSIRGTPAAAGEFSGNAVFMQFRGSGQVAVDESSHVRGDRHVMLISDQAYLD
ncbi:helix-turn-helix domain-containing protein [Rhodococcus sp. NPDC059968]|uniref:helix-turn-helix domain-containing protein n=1 Tax=Rhodococcus sp. NPDC059968 TaxID=3347017 RepID=UPI00366AA439